ncbi:MAG: capsule assembly Wzi family protein [Candidatus Amulumruptor caecigallinarius]|nr:capsule assembly Wzi family protein [Candidatus Amulumruptor caecigallinarius]
MKRILKCYFAGALTAMSMCAPGIAHAEWNDSIRYKAEIGAAFGGGDHNPFWLVSDKYGFSSIRKNNGYLRLSAFKDMNEDKKFDWGAGIDMGVAYRYSSVFVPQQLYAEIKYRCLDAYIGQKELNDPIVPSDLSSGALTISNNAHPIPQIRVGIFDYADFWGCNGWFAVKGHLAYGMFTDNWWLNRWVNRDSEYSLNTLYASRAIYFRGGNEKKFPLVGEIGLSMDTQFGGKTWIPGDKNNPGYWEKHPTYPKAWIKAMIPMKGGSDTAVGEQANVEGNMLGNWSFSLKWDDPRGWMVKLYYQHFFEDHSMMFFDYPWLDGLYGVRAGLPKNPFVSEIVYEFLYMKDQSGSVYWDHTPSVDYQVSGRDDYYNHYIYNGWQNWGMTLGNPFLISPIYNGDHTMYLKNSRVVAHHMGLKGSPLGNLDYRVLVSYNRSWGTYKLPLKKIESSFSWLAEVKYRPKTLKGWEGSLSFSMDAGSLLGHSYAALLTVSKTGFFRF